MNFHDTKMGQIFFKQQVPQLIASLQAIAEKLNKAAPVVKLPISPDPKFLNSLYFGTYQPEIFVRAEHSAELDSASLKAYEALADTLSPSQRKLLDDYHDTLAALSSEDLALAYRSGVHVAVQMILSGLYPEKQDSLDGASEV